MLDTESRHGTGLDQGPTKDPWLTMDYYLGTDSVSLQEMLDVDIKSEIENVIGEHNDMSFNFTDWPPLELDDNPTDSQDDLNKWLGSTSLLNGNSNSSSSNFNFDLAGGDASSVMVNPNSVMPLLSARPKSPTLNSDNNRRHFSFSSKELMKKGKVSVDDETEAEQDNDTETEPYENDVTETEDEEESQEEGEEEDEEDVEEEEEEEQENEIVKRLATIKPKQTIVLPSCALKTIAPQITKTQTITKVGHGLPSIRVQNVKLLSASQAQQVRKQIYNNNVHISPGATTITLKREKEYDLSDYDEKPYPKPAYSYSCLIAMALKNSQTGSLPVSEIYNFMCEHFPYFKTAPNGWKNSVRHNLSLNKCFEKIEKPAGNGNQRKGCLWAINPAKIAKMDEEVQKWSRKDPLAIKKAMIYPDHLELLERGEMKYSGMRNGELSEDTESSGDETIEENAPYDMPVHGHVAANSVTDSYDESSQDCDVDITDQVYDEIDIEENKDALHMQLNITKQQEDDEEEEDDEDEDGFEYELGPNAKRQKTLADALQRNYVYQPVTTSRRKTPLLLRAGATGSFLKID